MLRNASAMIAEREALRMGIEHLTVLFPTEVSSFDFQVECTDRTVQYKLNAQSLRLFGLHRDVNDAHRAGANRLQNKTKRPHRKQRARKTQELLANCRDWWNTQVASFPAVRRVETGEHHLRDCMARKRHKSLSRFVRRCYRMNPRYNNGV